MPLFTANYEGIRNLIKEDGIYENLSPIFYLLSAGLMFFLFIRSKSKGEIYFLKTNRNYFFLLLGLLFIIFCGEEISWGQRIFGIKTPETLQNANVQDEINIHNLWLFNPIDNNGNSKTGLKAWITSARLYALFWFSYCVIIPILFKISYEIRRFIRKINLPIISLWIGFLFIFNHVISKILEKLLLSKLSADTLPITEIKETSFAFLYLVASVSLFTIYKKATTQKGGNKMFR